MDNSSRAALAAPKSLPTFGVTENPPLTTKLCICFKLVDNLKGAPQQINMHFDLSTPQKFDCYESSSDSNGSIPIACPCIMTPHGGKMTNEKGEVLNGHYAINLMNVGDDSKVREFFIKGDWENGYPKGDIVLAREIDGKKIQHVGQITLADGQWEFNGLIKHRPMTSRQLSIDTTLTTLSDYTPLLSLAIPFNYIVKFPNTCLPCVMTEDRLAFQHSDGEYCLFNGLHAIKTDNFLISGLFEQGRPKGRMKLNIVDGSKKHNYMGMMTIIDGRCNFACSIRLLDGLVVITEKGLVRGKDLISERGKFEFTINGAVAIVDGKWEKGYPAGVMVFELVTNEGIINYKGHMLLVDTKLLFNGQGREELHYSSGKTKICDGNWENGKFTGKICFYDPTTGIAKITWNNSQREYNGQIHNDAPHGNGTMKCPGEWTYEGQFVNGEMHGKGTVTWDNGDIYDGRYAKGKREGDGVISWKNPKSDKVGDRYEGKFENDQRTGPGSYYFEDGTIVTGLWAAGRPIKDHSFIIPNKIKYSGPLNDAVKPNGTGWTWQWVGNSWSNRTKETWKNGVLKPRENATSPSPAPIVEVTNVQAVLTPSKSVSPKEKANITSAELSSKKIKNYLGMGCYEGFVNSANQPNGIGTLTHTNGNIYKGQWENGKPKGEFTIIYNTDKSNYIGAVKMIDPIQSSNKKHKKQIPAEIEPHGAGAIYDKDDHLVCVGEWEDGTLIKFIYPDMRAFFGRVNYKFEPDGKGKMQWPLDELICEATWKNGILTGQAKLIFLDGSFYIGTVDEAYRLHGTGSLTLANKINITGTWVHGVFNTDHAILSFPDKSMYEGPIDAQYQPNGEGVLRLENGDIVKGTWTNGVQHIVPEPALAPNEPVLEEPVNNQNNPNEQDKKVPLPEVQIAREESTTQGTLPIETNRSAITKAVSNRSDLHAPSHEFKQISYGKGSYTGYVENNVPNGHGQLNFAGGLSYLGMFKNGQINLNGVTIKLQDVTYRPLFNPNSKNDIQQLTFYGEMLRPGSKYLGWIEHGQPHGYGTLQTSIGDVYDVYDGTFRNGNVYGNGILHKANGNVYHATNFTREAMSTLNFDYGEMWSVEGYHFKGPIKVGKPFGDGTLIVSGNGANLYETLFNKPSIN